MSSTTVLAPLTVPALRKDGQPTTASLRLEVEATTFALAAAQARLSSIVLSGGPGFMRAKVSLATATKRAVAAQAALAARTTR